MIEDVLGMLEGPEPPFLTQWRQKNTTQDVTHGSRREVPAPSSPPSASHSSSAAPESEPPALAADMQDLLDRIHAAGLEDDWTITTLRIHGPDSIVIELAAPADPRSVVLELSRRDEGVRAYRRTERLNLSYRREVGGVEYSCDLELIASGADFIARVESSPAV